MGVEILCGGCDAGDVMMCWEMICLWVGWQFVCVACVVVFDIVGISKFFVGWVL